MMQGSRTLPQGTQSLGNPPPLKSPGQALDRDTALGDANARRAEGHGQGRDLQWGEVPVALVCSEGPRLPQEEAGEGGAGIGTPAQVAGATA